MSREKKLDLLSEAEKANLTRSQQQWINQKRSKSKQAFASGVSYHFRLFPDAKVVYYRSKTYQLLCIEMKMPVAQFMIDFVQQAVYGQADVEIERFRKGKTSVILMKGKRNAQVKIRKSS